MSTFANWQLAQHLASFNLSVISMPTWGGLWGCWHVVMLFFSESLGYMTNRQFHSVFQKIDWNLVSTEMPLSTGHLWDDICQNSTLSGSRTLTIKCSTKQAVISANPQIQAKFHKNTKMAAFNIVSHIGSWSGKKRTLVEKLTKSVYGVEFNEQQWANVGFLLVTNTGQ